MLKKVLGLLVLGLVLASCGTPVPTGSTTVKDVTPTSGDSRVTVSWTFSGDTNKINGFKIVRDDGTGYKDLTTLSSKTARSHDDTSVVQGGNYKYGVAVIDSAGKVGTVVNQAGVGVGPNPVSVVNLSGTWTLVATNTLNANQQLTLTLVIVDTAGTLSGSTKNFDGSIDFGPLSGSVQDDAVILRLGSQATFGGHWNVSATVADETSFSGTYEAFNKDEENDTTKVGEGPITSTKQ
jgi:hypothetical protein